MIPHSTQNYRLAYENAKDIIALGFDPKKTFIFSDYSKLDCSYFIEESLDLFHYLTEEIYCICLPLEGFFFESSEIRTTSSMML